MTISRRSLEAAILRSKLMLLHSLTEARVRVVQLRGIYNDVSELVRKKFVTSGGVDSNSYLYLC